MSLGAAIMVAMMGCGHSKTPLGQVEAQGGSPGDPANMHTVTVTFDYDFSKAPACSPKPTKKNCIKEFHVFDVSGGQYKLFTIPAPVGATGMVKGITVQSSSRAFEPGTHFIAVTATDATGLESNSQMSKTSVEVKRKSSK